MFRANLFFAILIYKSIEVTSILRYLYIHELKNGLIMDSLVKFIVTLFYFVSRENLTRKAKLNIIKSIFLLRYDIKCNRCFSSFC